MLSAGGVSITVTGFTVDGAGDGEEGGALPDPGDGSDPVSEMQLWSQIGY